jgi:hypothetical protein
MLLNLFALTAAATAGVDLAANDRNNVSSKPRIMRGVACVGSVAVNDFYVDVFIGNHFVGRFYNTKIATNQIAINEDVVPVGRRYVPPGDKIAVICGVNAGAGNVNVGIY